MKDAVFKSLKHSCSGFEPFKKGGEVEKGYKPDYVLRNDNDYILMECESFEEIL
jgi:hypothetical protein